MKKCSQQKQKQKNETEKHLCLRSAISLKKRLWHSCFPVNLAKFLRTTFLQNTSKGVLLNLTFHFTWFRSGNRVKVM